MLEVWLSLLWKLLSGALSQKSDFQAENDVDPPNMLLHRVAHRASTEETFHVRDTHFWFSSPILNDLFILLY